MSDETSILEAARWSKEKAAAWLAREGFRCGFNYVPRTAVNSVELWQAATFDPSVIEEELGWAARVGFNSLRVFLNYVVYADEPAAFLARVDRFLAIAARHGMKTMPVLLDDCSFGGRDPVVGPQPEPAPGVHNSRWVGSPGPSVVRDRTQWPKLERYVKDVIGRFADDERVLVWDLYNEPGNDWVFAPDAPTYSEPILPHSLALLHEAYAWARACHPTQPLTAGSWDAAATDANDRLARLADVLSFHSYGNLETLDVLLDSLAPHERPILCTEWLARLMGSKVETHLPYFRERMVSCFQWGLVQGRTQTHLPWPSYAAFVTDPSEWFHDLLLPDGSPYDPREIEAYRRTLQG